MRVDPRLISCLLLLTVLPVRAEDPPTTAPSDLPVIHWKDAGQYYGREVIVQGKIIETRNIGKICFLNFDAARSFTAIIRQANYAKFPEPPERLYAGKEVRIRGFITQFKDKPQIEIVRPEQVTFGKGEVPATTQPTTPPKVRREFTGTVRIATFNILNLFDEHDDPYRADEGTPTKPSNELAALAKTIREVDADVLALQEVENRGILEQFNRTYLADLGYEHVVLFEGNDLRGIDCALLSRLPVGPVTSHRHVRFHDDTGRLMSFNRDLLQVEIQPPAGSPFHVFVVHLKSKRDGADETEPQRLGETRQIRKVLDGLLKQDRSALFVICGDFNDTRESKPIQTLLGDGPTALTHFLADLPSKAETYNKRPGGMIDFIFASPEMGRRYVPKSYRIVSGEVATHGSDHNPVVAEFDWQTKE